MFYRCIVIENSLHDKSILKKYPILSETVFAANDPARKSRMLKIRVPESEVDQLINSLTENIIPPYYTHLYSEDKNNDRLIVVFSNKKFLTKKSNYKDAIDYGIAHGVSPEEISINPLDITKEDW